jgi:membrane fusion protein, heavy metal efflux system
MEKPEPSETLCIDNSTNIEPMRDLTDKHTPRALPVKGVRSLLLVLIIGGGLGIAADRLLLAPKRSPELTRSAAASIAEQQSPFTRVGDRIVVPPNSLLRSQLGVAEVTSQEVSRKLTLPAMVEADPARTVKVLPPVGGLVTALDVELGQRVEKGRELVVIDSGDLALAYSDRDKARAQLTLTKKALDRMMTLERVTAISVKDREGAQNDYAQAQAELERTELRLRAIGATAELKEGDRHLVVKAPVSGSVIDLEIAAGTVINDPTAAIMTIANLDTVWVTANVPEKDISFVYAGQTVDVTFPSYPEKAFSGKVLFVSDVIEPDTRRNKVRIAFDNSDKILKPNMFANATFVAPSVSQLTVPTSALLMTNDTTSVFVEVADWAFERRTVEIASQEGTSVAIKSGLQKGDRVVIKGGVRIND